MLVRRGKPASERWASIGRLERQEAPWSVRRGQWARESRDSLGQWKASNEGASSVRSVHRRSIKLERLGQAETRILRLESLMGQSERSTEVSRSEEQDGGITLATIEQPGVSRVLLILDLTGTILITATQITCNTDLCERSLGNNLTKTTACEQRTVGHIQSCQLGKASEENILYLHLLPSCDHLAKSERLLSVRRRQPERETCVTFHFYF